MTSTRRWRRAWLALGGAALLVAPPSAARGDDGGPRTRYTLDVRLDERAHSLDGHVSIEYGNRGAATLDELFLHLHANAYSGPASALALDRLRLPFYSDPASAVPSGEDAGSIQVTSLSVAGQSLVIDASGPLLRVALASPLAPGAQVEIRIAFHVRIPAFRDRFGHRDGNYAITAWFPKMAVRSDDGWHTTPLRAIGEFHSEAADYRVAITTVAGLLVGATGERVDSVGNEDGTVTTRWTADGVRDFAWVADASYRVRRATRDGITVEYLYLARDEKAAERGLALAQDALRFFGERYGRYPYATFRVAESAAIGTGLGIEFPQIVLISRDLHRSASVLTAFESTVVHEVAHQWWYGLVGNDETAEAWLDESFATYATRRFWRERGGEPPMMRVPRALRFLSGPTDSEIGRWAYASAAHFGLDQEIRRAAADFDDAQSYVVSVYYKGSFVLDMLEGLLGTPTFDAVLAAYVERQRGRIATTNDFVDVAESVSGRPLRWFFTQWLDSTATCDYGVDGITVRADPDGFLSSVTLRRHGDVVMPVTVRLTLDNGVVLDRGWDGEEETTVVEVRAEAPVRSALLDPDLRLLETSRVNNVHPRRVQRTFNPLTVRDDAYVITHVPWAWYDDGLEVGLLLWAGYPPLPVFPAGVEREHGGSASVSHNFARDRTTYSVRYGSPLGIAGQRAFWGIGTERRRGRERADVGVRWYGGPHLYRGPCHAVEARLEMDRWTAEAEAYYDAMPFEAGTLHAARFRYAYNDLVTDYYPVSGGVSEVTATLSDDAFGSAWSFASAFARVERYRATPMGVLAAAAVHGSTWGSPPPQELPSLRRHAGLVGERFERAVARRLTAAQVELRPPLMEGLLSLAVAARGAWHPDVEDVGDWSGEVSVGVRWFANMPYAIQVDVPVFTAVEDGSRWRLGNVVVRFGRPFRVRER